MGELATLLILASAWCVVCSVGMGWFVAIKAGGLKGLNKLYKLLLGDEPR